jgi:hydrogenase maturation factor
MRNDKYIRILGLDDFVVFIQEEGNVKAQNQMVRVVNLFRADHRGYSTSSSSSR